MAAPPSPQNPDNTIFALASPPGRGGVAVIRVSGKQAGDAILALTGKTTLPDPRRAVLSRLADPESGREIDRALLLYFKAPASFTGEDVAEFHVHGGLAVVTALQESLGQMPGVRQAEPGEFSRRAFENGRMDLTEAEAIADLVDAETAAQHEQALRQLGGELGRLYDGWADRLKKGLAHLEADIDFPDEDLPEGVSAALRPELEKLRGEIGAHLDDNRRGERLRGGFTIAVIGAPNAGKSSLINALARRDVAIVSPLAGTTRDVIEAHLDLGGYPVTVADTAGLRGEENESADEIEHEGIRRALLRAKDADLKLALFNVEQWPALDKETLALVDDDTIPVLNKSDLKEPGEAEVKGLSAEIISVKTGDGLPSLLERLTAEIRSRIGVRDAPTLTRQRHRRALEECAQYLDRAISAAQPELAAEDVRQAVRALGRITGHVGVEDLLDVIFRDFCIGK